MVDDVRGSKENERKFSMTSSTSFISKYNEYYLLIVIFLISHHWIAAAAACLLGFRFPLSTCPPGGGISWSSTQLYIRTRQCGVARVCHKVVGLLLWCCECEYYRVVVLTEIFVWKWWFGVMHVGKFFAFVCIRHNLSFLSNFSIIVFHNFVNSAFQNCVRGFSLWKIQLGKLQCCFLENEQLRRVITSKYTKQTIMMYWFRTNFRLLFIFCRSASSCFCYRTSNRKCSIIWVWENDLFHLSSLYCHYSFAF